MFRWFFCGAFLVGTGAALVSCGDSTSETLCEAGTEVFCKCRGGFDGTKTCLDDGLTFGECTTAEGPCPEIEETTSSGTTQICTPDEDVTCSCDNGDEGMKSCASDGLSFSDCMTASGACGTTTVGDKLLFEACAAGGECNTGVCDSGYCTRSCESFEECADPANEIVGECIRFSAGAKQNCAPFCFDQPECQAYGETILCGGAVALDDDTFAFAACAEWGAEAVGFKIGTPCDSETGELLYYGENLVEMECHVGLAGVQDVCTFGECTKGCFEDQDCPLTDCSSNGSVIGCCVSESDCDP